MSLRDKRDVGCSQASIDGLVGTLNTALDSPRGSGPPLDNWAEIVRLARYHRLEYALFSAIAGKDRGRSLEGMEDLKCDYLENAVEADVRFDVWEELHSRLERASVRCFLVSGAALCCLVYDGDLAQDVSRDIDLLVPPEDIAAFRAVMEAEGATRAMPKDEYGWIVPFDPELTIPGGVGAPTMYIWKKLVLDVKATFVGFAGLCSPQINPFSNPLNVTCRGVTFLTPRLSVQVAMQAIHAVVHGSSRRLFFFYELARLCHIHRGEIDWDEIVSWRNSWFGPLLHNVFEVSTKYFKVQIPSEVMAALHEPHKCSAYRRWVPLDPLVASREQEMWRLNLFFIFLFVLTCGSVRARLKLVRNLVLPPVSCLLPCYQRRPVYLRYWYAMYFKKILLGAILGYLKPARWKDR